MKSRFHRMFLPSHSLDTVSPSDLLLCFELLSPELAKEQVVVLEVQQVSGGQAAGTGPCGGGIPAWPGLAEPDDPPQRPQVPSIPISKCAACQRKQQPEDEKLKRCTRCYRVGYCNQ